MLSVFNKPRLARPYVCAADGPLDLARIAKLIEDPDAQVVVMAGAGVSTSAGIPDFRTPGTGLYDNLQEYGLPYPEAIFDLGFYRSNPKPFQRLCRELWPGNFAPTPTHAFFKVLHDKGKLVRCYTQNIDSLEHQAGLPKEQIVAAHGNFDAAHVVGSGRAVPVEEVREAAFGDGAAWDALAARHGGLVKPSIVFFGEALPHRFFELAPYDMRKCTLLLVLGTSLAVHPFAGLVGEVDEGTPRLLVNREKVGEWFSLPNGFRFDHDDGGSSSSDGFYQGDTDTAVRELCELLGWTGELQAVVDATAKLKVSCLSEPLGVE